MGLTIVDGEQEGIKNILVMNQIREFEDNALHKDTRIPYEDRKVNKELNKIEYEVIVKTNNDIMRDKYKDQFDDVAKIVRPWEELQLKRNQSGLGYVKDHDNHFHIPD